IGLGVSSGVPDLDGPNLYVYYPNVNGMDPWGLECSGEGKCGPDVTDIIIRHINEFISQDASSFWGTWQFGAYYY
ncbi:MAG: hypothetical protein MPJ24_02805, partial [Pirellulaceae bacterium]|nr:hypothetical protein [Pirellulaceae bacterium]